MDRNKSINQGRAEPHDESLAVPCPKPGDLIVVERSAWYALADGELLRVCEYAGWVMARRDLFVAPRSQVRTFWGPNFGPPDGTQPLHISTSGGPFKSITLALVDPLQRLGTELDIFWHWRDWPRAGGGVEYEREVTVWKLPFLPDRGTWLPTNVEGSR